MKPAARGRLAILFVKEPVPGAVKSRLAAGVGEAAACRFYQKSVAAVRDALLAAAPTLRVCHAPADAAERLAPWLGADVGYRAQVEGDLGTRMRAAFTEAFADGYTAAVLVGGDVPLVSGPAVTRAFAALGSQGAALGPAADGGYWLAGFRAGSFLPAAFDAIPWSTSGVLAATRARFAAAGRPVALVDTLPDVDTLEDARRALAQAEAAGCGGPGVDALRELVRASA